MRKIMDSEHENPNAMREVSIESFLQQLNAALIAHDPAFAAEKGIKDGRDNSETPKF